MDFQPSERVLRGLDVEAMPRQRLVLGRLRRYGLEGDVDGEDPVQIRRPNRHEFLLGTGRDIRQLVDPSSVSPRQAFLTWDHDA